MTITDLAPIVLFVYNRPWHTQQTLNALMQNELASESTLYIFSDGAKPGANTEQAKKIAEVRRTIHSTKGFKDIIIKESEVNKGLAISIIEGVTEVINKHGKVIVLEDDLVTSPYFLKFMNEGLTLYETDFRIFSIGGVNYNFPIPKHYIHDIYIAHRTESCGWGTWADRWAKSNWNKSDYSEIFTRPHSIKRFNRGGDDLSNLLKLQLEGKIDSWAIRWDYCHYEHDAYCLRPIYSLIKNIGFDGTGTHSDAYNGALFSGNPYSETKYDIQLTQNIAPDKKLEKNFKQFFGGKNRTLYNLFRKLKKRIKIIWKKLPHKILFLRLYTILPYSSIFGLDRGMPIDRLYIENFLNKHRNDITGRILEIADSEYSKKFGHHVDAFEILHFDDSNKNATIVGDLSHPDELPEDFCDCFICTQTLNFIYDVKSAIRGSHKVLSNGGVFLGTVAGISQISRYDMERWGDFWRFTSLSILKMFEEVYGTGHVEIQAYGNALAATAFLQGLSVENIINKQKLMVVDDNYQLIIGIRAVK